jgi:hypothetical protein
MKARSVIDVPLDLLFHENGPPSVPLSPWFFRG